MRRPEGPWPSAEGCGANPDPSPGDWTPPPGVMPGWNWTPPGGLLLRPEGLPWWVRVWRRIPVLERYAQVWMWHHGGFTFPPSWPGGDGDRAVDRAPLCPVKPRPPAARRRELSEEQPRAAR